MIRTGTILIEGNAPRPHCFQVEDEGCPDAWMSVKHGLTFQQLEAELSATGWTFFYMANTIRMTAFGFNRDSLVHRSLKRVMADVRQRGCNCLQIDDVVTDSFLGVPRVRVSAHPRHIQKGMVFSGQLAANGNK